MSRPRTVLIGLFASITALGLESSVHPGLFAQATHSQRIVSLNRMGLTITNYGFLGSNFINRSPSLEYPNGTGYEHLPHGGLWIGASAVDDAGAFHGVTTACLDMFQGSSSTSATEFSPARTGFEIRSMIPSSPFYSADAVSEEDALSWYTDALARQAAGNPGSRPACEAVPSTRRSAGR